MRSRNPGYAYACFFAVLFAIFGIILLYQAAVGDTNAFRRMVAGMFLITFSGWFTWRLLFHSVLDWIIVPSMVPDQRVAFARQGPNSDIVDEFTVELQKRIVQAVQPPVT